MIALGETELAAGRRGAARRDLELVRAQQALLAGAGVNTDVELAIFEADHGDPRRGLALARAAWAAAPERAVRGRARLGAEPRRAAARGPALGAPRAATRLARRRVALPRRYDRARRRSPERGTPQPAARARATAWTAQPLHAARAREALR